MTSEAATDYEERWQKLKDIETVKEATKTPQGKPSEIWTQARRQMLAIQERGAKRARADEERRRQKEAGLAALRKQAEEDSRKHTLLGDSMRMSAEQEAKKKEQQRAEERKKERDRLETMGPSVALEEAWDVFS
jgi:hypothetical protein